MSQLQEWSETLVHLHCHSVDRPFTGQSFLRQFLRLALVVKFDVVAVYRRDLCDRFPNLEEIVGAGRFGVKSCLLPGAATRQTKGKT